MRYQKLHKSWERTRGHLQSAFSILPQPLFADIEGGSVTQYRDFIDNNELELALNELEMLGDANPVSVDFWQCLLNAALEMKLTDHIERYRKKVPG